MLIKISPDDIFNGLSLFLDEEVTSPRQTFIGRSPNHSNMNMLVLTNYAGNKTELFMADDAVIALHQLLTDYINDRKQE